MGLLELHVRHLGAVAGMPTQGRAAETPGVVDQEQDKLERVREADNGELRGRSERHGCVP
jgi:hypothetical protein